MEFYKVIKTRRSIRSYKQTPVPKDALDRILEAVRIAPSGHNRQPWKFLIYRDTETKQKIAKGCNDQKWIAEAPIVIVALGQRFHFSRGKYMGEMSFIMDIGIAMTHLILAARAEELGTCWIGAFDNSLLKESLNVAEGWDVVAITPLGYPDEGKFTENTTRKPLEEVVKEA